MPRIPMFRSAVWIVVLSLVTIAPTAGAQVGRSADKAHADEQQSCRRAARLVKADAAVPKDDRDDDRGDEQDKRNGGDNDESNDGLQMSKAKLLSCGAYGGAVVGSIIRAHRSDRDAVRLDQLVGSYGNFRDTAVYSAFRDVAVDKAASEAARIRALLGLFKLRTGHYWLSRGYLHGTLDGATGKPVAPCESGLNVTDATPFWYEGTPLPVNYGDDIKARAKQIWNDPSEPFQVRSAASCAM
ncbi:MAG: hypothetical protein ABJE10_18260 [bacterium]